MSFEVIFSILVGVAALAVFAFTVAYRPRPHDIDNVILLARKLDVSDLEALFDAASEWNVRRSLTKWALREVQEGRMRLAREYLRRVAHNSNLIHLWVLQEHEHIQWKEREDYTDRDLLVVEALQLATDLRLYSIAVFLKIWLWMAFKAYRWPARLLPRMPDLRVQCGVNVLEKYRRLTDLALALSARYGSTYRDQMLQAL